jgi:signal peptidase I
VSDSDKGKGKSGSGSLLELVAIVVTALGLALGIQAFIVKPYRIPSQSMEPTLDIGQRVLVNRLGNNFSDPSIGEVMVFHPPAGHDSNTCGAPHEGDGTSRPCGVSTGGPSSVNFIKRVVGLPGDTIAIRNGHVIRNGKATKESFIRECAQGADCNFPKPITVPKGHYFMMGDNRGESDDSRYWGPVAKKNLIGGAFATYWPPKRIGLL